MASRWPWCPGPLTSNVGCFGDPASGALASLTLLRPPRLGHQNSLHSRFSAKQQAVLSPENQCPPENRLDLCINKSTEKQDLQDL